jgi:predicted TIM-barrel fold metal-dependent hydrolase
MENSALQEACFKVYNDWLIEYCQVAPKRLLGIACISVYDIDHAVQELERCVKAGLKGAMIWMVAHPDLPFYASHYDRFWAAAQSLGTPVSLHTLTGRNPKESKHLQIDRHKAENLRRTVNIKTMECVNALFDLLIYGTLERFSRLKIVMVEGEIGWIPFMLQQWDLRYRRVFENDPLPITMDPSDYFHRQVYATFIHDDIGAKNLQLWGMDNCMWSSDYPHLNSHWPNSRKVIAQTMAHLSAETCTKVLWANVAELYRMEDPQSVRN